MRGLTLGVSCVALLAATNPVNAQSEAKTNTATMSGQGDPDTQDRLGATDTDPNEIVVTATRHKERLQDVPISITAFSQSDLTQKGIVGFSGIARQTPGVVLNERSDNNLSITTRGVSTNGYQAGLQSTTTVYLDELPLTTIGNSVTLNPNLYDVERVEFLRGPQGTLFGSGSLSGALRIITKSPELDSFDSSALADIGVTFDGGGIRQRYNGMVNVPLVKDKLGLRVVGFYRHEDGYIDNIGLNRRNSNTLKDWGGRAIMLFKPTDRLSIRLMALYEDSYPEDASLVTPSLGDRKRYTTIPDLYTSKTQLYNGTIEYQLNGAHLTSSTSYAHQDGLFVVDLSGTFGLALPFYLFDHGVWNTFVQETRLVSDPGGKIDWTIGGYYLHRDSFLEGRQTSTPEYLAAKGITGLPADATFNQFSSDTRSYELAGFGELTYHLTDKLSATGGIRYGKYGGTLDTYAGFNSQYFVYALSGISGPLARIPTAPTSTTYPSSAKASWKASLTYMPSRNLTTYVTVATGYRTPVYNARAGLVSTVDPSDIVIPPGATSDNLINYEAGLKGRFWDGKLTANIAAYYIDWRNIQVQANRQSDSVQFSTNVGGAVSKGLEAEITLAPVRWLTLGLNGSLNDAKITDLTPEEAAISGAVKDARLASPHVQGSLFGNLNYDLMGGAKGFTGFQVQYVGSFPDGFPNTPGKPNVPSPLFDYTDAYTNINIQTGIRIGRLTTTFYMENVTNSRAVTYVHPEAFIYSRYAILRPRTFGVRIGYNL